MSLTRESSCAGVVDMLVQPTGGGRRAKFICLGCVIDHGVTVESDRHLGTASQDCYAPCC